MARIHDEHDLTDNTLVCALRRQQVRGCQTCQLSKAACHTSGDLCEVNIHAFVSENAAFDLVVAEAEVRRLEERLVDVLVEAQSYRVTAREALHALHALTVDHRELRQTHDELVDEYRGFRERLLRDAVVTP